MHICRKLVKLSLWFCCYFLRRLLGANRCASWWRVSLGGRRILVDFLVTFHDANNAILLAVRLYVAERSDYITTQEHCLLGVGGLPIGAVLVTQAVADVMSPGDHGSTFAGNPLVCHAAEAVVDIITEEGFLEDVTRKGEKLRAGLESALGSNPHVKQVRGLGLIVGVQLDVVSTLAVTFLHSLAVGLVSVP